uniref:Uncharacterized protein n=1 Tax=Bionectria ochroleuca TaxID=29856 RepID=A0A0B7KQH3_BIOOC
MGFLIFTSIDYDGVPDCFIPVTGLRC